jgi:phage FluMu protein Com
MKTTDLHYCPRCKEDQEVRIETGQMDTAKVESLFCAKCNTFLSSKEIATGGENGTR